MAKAKEKSKEGLDKLIANLGKKDGVARLLAYGELQGKDEFVGSIEVNNMSRAKALWILAKSLEFTKEEIYMFAMAYGDQKKDN